MQTEQLKVIAGGKTITIGETILAINNISYVSTSVPQAPFPYWAIVFVVAGFLLMGMERAFAIGLVLLLVGIALVGLVVWQNQHQPKGVHLQMNSGKTVSILFEDHREAYKLLNLILRSINEPNTSQTIVVNGSINNSTVGAFGSLSSIGSFNNGK